MRSLRTTVAGLLLLIAVPALAHDVRVDVDAEARVRVNAAGDAVLEVLPRRGDGYIQLARRYSEERRWKTIHKANRRRSLIAGVRRDVPYDLLSAEWQRRVAAALFPEDRASGGAWVHRVGTGKIPADHESVTLLARLYTPSADQARALARELGLGSARTRLVEGRRLSLPRDLLIEPYRSAAVASLAPPEPLVLADGVRLEYGSDDRGEHAIYHLRAGEALYSSVVIRFTGRVHASEVNELAFSIAERSDIRDVTDIPIGYPVKVPFDVLLPEYLPPGSTARLDYEAGLAEAGRNRNTVESRDLAGVHVVLDAGHGGIDRGAMHHGVWESDYVYDVMCRIKSTLEQRTAARVVVTTEDRSSNFRVRDSEKLDWSQDHQVLTTPPYAHRSSSQGGLHTNLRWYLTNSVYRELVAQGVEPEKVVFTSLHADALHRSLSGVMIYVPGERYRRGTCGQSGPAYERYHEFRQQRSFQLGREQRLRSEGLSRELAGELIDGFRARGVSIHPYKPVRDHVVRKRKQWVPAVLRCSQVPASVLIELSNLANKKDGARLRDPDYRQQLADAYVDGLLDYYGSQASASAPVAAR